MELASRRSSSSSLPETWSLSETSSLIAPPIKNPQRPKTCNSLRVRLGIFKLSVPLLVGLWFYVFGGVVKSRIEVLFGKIYKRGFQSTFPSFQDQWKVYPSIPKSLSISKTMVVRFDSQHFVLLGGHSRETFMYDIQSGTRQRLPDMLNDRLDACVSMVDRKLYVMGGYRQTTGEVLDLTNFDANQNNNTAATQLEWNMIQPMSVVRAGCAALSVRQFIYVLGGFATTNGGHQSKDIIYHRTIEVYDTVQRIWRITSLNSPPPLPIGLGLLEAVVLDDEQTIVVLGGDNAIQLPSSAVMFATVDPETASFRHKWKYLPSMTLPRSNFAAAVVNGSMVAVAGGRYRADDLTPTAEIIDLSHYYQRDTDDDHHDDDDKQCHTFFKWFKSSSPKWEKLPPLSIKLQNHAGVSFSDEQATNDNTIVLFGGIPQHNTRNDFGITRVESLRIL